MQNLIQLNIGSVFCPNFKSLGKHLPMKSQILADNIHCNKKQHMTKPKNLRILMTPFYVNMSHVEYVKF